MIMSCLTSYAKDNYQIKGYTANTFSKKNQTAGREAAAAALQGDAYCTHACEAKVNIKYWRDYMQYVCRSMCSPVLGFCNSLARLLNWASMQSLHPAIHTLSQSLICDLVHCNLIKPAGVIDRTHML